MNHLQQKRPSSEEAALARLSSRELSAVLETRAEIQKVTMTDRQGVVHNMDIPVSALRLLIDVLTELGDGNSVKLIPIGSELTTQEAADMLNVSRPTLIRMLDNAEIPYHRIGNRRKLRYTDIVAYRERTRAARISALDELSALDQELGLGYE
ncbi:helix-turn-helix domain-containing protein [Biostraticola tofi]|uniref:Excisionase family DNA binding protein n=1 Tax=Biostraticola tofi TaxID=466109 RepID=A0A4R3Z0B0_9GAMM|nr:helix-turn-helix domain-containing protein [Biostraticola tofi]TCV98400.1 excisionase family DNA binding protein [Biostraticola tofi]